MKHYIAKTQFGLEEVLAKELADLGAKNTEILNRAVAFEANQQTLYAIHLHSALCLRIIEPLLTFEANNEEDFYQKVKAFDWLSILKVEDTFKIDSVVNSSFFKHSHYISLKTKDAICDSIRQKTGKRPNIDVRKPTFVFSLHVREKQAQIALDATAISLHQRKYRLEGAMAPLNEVLAAGMIALSDWDKKTPFLDGMCGSGTLVIEALMQATNKAIGDERRHFGFMNWPNFDEKLWNQLKKEAENKYNYSYQNIKGIEIDSKNLQAAKDNMVRAGFLPIHHLQHGDFFNYKPKETEGVVFLNPPYDERIKDEHINDFYERIGDHLKNNFKGWTAWIISGNMEARKHIGLKPSVKIKLFNGQIDCRFMKFELF